MVHRESVPVDLDHRRWLTEVNRDHVEAARAARETVPDHIALRELRDAAALPEVDRLRRVAEGVAPPRLHLHEHDRVAVARDDIQFAAPASVAAGNDCVPPALQLATREI